MGMKTITLSGILKYEYEDNWMRIKLVQDDGYKIDLVGRFNEAAESYKNSSVQVSYYLSDKPCTKNEMIEGWLKSISGSIDAGYTTDSYRYSSWTHVTDYDTNLKIGGHNLYNELRDSEGRFIIIELNFKEN
jgi:hypothetical protein